MAVKHHVQHHVRAAAQLAPGRPALWLGLRVALATAVPLALAPLLPAEVSGWAPLAGFSVALADKGGAYRTRARHLAAVAAAAIVGIALGSAIAGHGAITGAVVAVVLGVASFAQAWSPAALSASNTFAIQLLVAASLPCSATEVALRTEGTAFGAAFAIVLALVVWPVRVYKPGRRAAAAMLDGLADHARAIATGTAARDALVARHRPIRERIETARGVLAATRRGSRGASGRGERLLAIVQVGDQLFGTLIGLEELLDGAGDLGDAAAARTAMAEVADDLAQLARAIVVEDATAHARVAAPGPRTGDPIALLVGRARDEAALIAGFVDSLRDDAPAPTPAAPPVPLESAERALPPSAAIADAVREAVDPAGLAWRHAVRVGIVVALAMAIARAFDLSHRYWVTLNAFLLLQPYGAATRVKALQRVAGTVLGGVLAAAIPYLVDDPRAEMVIVVVLAGASASVLSLNYALYATFLTPTFVLLAEVHAADAHLVGIRIVNTLIGAALAIGGTLVWRAPESVRFDDELADALACAAAYVDAAAAGNPTTKLRRAFGVALNRADLAFERLVAERPPTEIAEPRMTELAFLRRFGSALTALVAMRAPPSPAQAELGARAAETLRALAAAARDRRAPPPAYARAANTPPELARLDRILATLADAAARAR